ncbi:MAG: adenylate/guanylate cyclase domain-containing protein [Beggiatoa sp. IS2]|nr:MAG: adenylate/guanylate cyclase domain-containing protein [Beggiatoa sp. IS2]
MSNLFIVIKRHFLRIFISIAILGFFVLHVVGTLQWEFIKELEFKAYDARLEVTMPKIQDLRIIIVDIDEKSLKEIGRWPWNRLIMANLVNKLFDTYQINTLGFDVILPEPDDSSGLKVLHKLAEEQLHNVPEFSESLRNLELTLDYDAIFAKSLQNRKIVLGYAFATEDETQQIETGQLPPPIFTAKAVQEYGLKYAEATGFVTSLPRFQEAVKLAGHFSSNPDSDGIVRRVSMLYGYKGALYESLSLAVTRIVLGLPDIELNIVSGKGGYHSIESLRLGSRLIPVDEYFQTLVPFRGKRGSFPYISASDVLYGRVDPNLLKGKIVLIGTSAQGLMDLRATPVESTYPGVEVHANLIAGILDQYLTSKPAYMNSVEILLLLSIGFIIILIVSLLNPLWSTLVTFAMFAGVIWLNLAVWQQAYIVIPIAATLLMTLSLFILNMSFGYFVEASHKRQLAGMFGQYVPPELVDEMSKNPSRAFSVEGESRELTVFFSDVRGFTTISEGLDPKALSELMNAYLTPMTHIIHDHRGTIDKYMGDAIMAFWGAPLPDPPHARHALDACMAMLARLEEMQSEFAARGWPPIKIGMGLNTGIMSVGNMGSKFRMAYTVLGDAVNLGSRLEGLTKQYGVQIIASETTKAAAPDYAYRELDRVRVKGKDQPVAIFEPIGLHDKVTQSLVAELSSWERALEHYRQQQWGEVREQLLLLQQQFPQCLLYRIYAERVEYFSKNPPGDNWDGVYTFKTK